MSWIGKKHSGVYEGYPCIASFRQRTPSCDGYMAYIISASYENCMLAVGLLDDMLTIPGLSDLFTEDCRSWQRMRDNLMAGFPVAIQINSAGIIGGNLPTGEVHWQTLVPRFAGEHLSYPARKAVYKTLTEGFGIRPVLAATLMYQFTDTDVVRAGRSDGSPAYRYARSGGWGDQSPFNQSDLWDDYKQLCGRWLSFKNASTFECTGATTVATPNGHGVSWWGEPEANPLNDSVATHDVQLFRSACRTIEGIGIPHDIHDFQEETITKLREALSIYQHIFNSIVMEG